MSWNASTLLETHDRGHGQSPISRASVLLASSHTSLNLSNRESVGSIPVGRTNQALLDICRRDLGLVTLDAIADCPRCGSQLETSLHISQLRQWLSTGSDVLSPNQHRVQCGEYELEVRDLVLADLHAAESMPDLDTARRALFQNCILSCHKSGVPATVDQLPGEVLTAVSNRLGELDPAGDPRVDLTCAECGHQFELGLDLTSHAWMALDAAAAHLLTQVAALARGFGWTESDVFALSANRRMAYLKMLSDPD